LRSPRRRDKTGGPAADWIARGPGPYLRAGEPDDRRAIFFRHDADLLRQRPAAFRARLHHRGGRRAGALHAARRLPRQIPDRHRRAWPEGRALGAGRRHDAAAIHRPGVGALSRGDPADGHQQRRFHPHDRGEARARRRGEAFYEESELVDGKAPTGAEVEWLEEENYFFRLSNWQQRLLDFYEANPESIAPRSRRNEVISFVRGGLKDLSVSRTSFSWGIPVPGNPKHVMYVWLDALTNYITALGYPEVEKGEFPVFWPADLHIVGKDILRFHTVYWHAFLMAAGIAPPRRVFAHGWWTVEGEKMSKSLGNFIPPQLLVETYGLDPVRYFLLRELPFGSDGNFSHRAVVGRLNGDLANDFGNLAQRVLAMINRNCGGEVPEPGAFSDDDKALLAAARGLVETVRGHMREPAFHLALEAIWRIVGEANRYVDTAAPWVLARSEPARMRTVLYTLAETLRHLAIMTQPFVPGSAARLLDQLAVPAGCRDFAALAAAPLAAGTKLPRPEGIFPRFAEAKERA
jgi:methionyl-tRNA synthetase